MTTILEMERRRLIEYDELLTEVDPTDTVAFYLRESSQFPPLKKAQQLILAKDMQEARERLDHFGALPEETISSPETIDEAWITYTSCHNALTQSYLKMVVSRAKKHIGRGMTLADLIQEGNIGLLQSLGRFRYQEGVKVGTYASYWIDRTVVDALEGQSQSVSTPSNSLFWLKKIDDIKDEFLQNTGREPTVEEIAREMKWTPNTVGNFILVFQGVLSLNEDIGDEGDLEPQDFLISSDLPVDTQAMQQIGKERVGVVLGRVLKSRDAQVIDGRYGLSSEGKTKTAEELSKKFKVTRQRIGQIEKEGFEKLRDSRNEAELRNAWEELVS